MRERVQDRSGAVQGAGRATLRAGAGGSVYIEGPTRAQLREVEVEEGDCPWAVYSPRISGRFSARLCRACEELAVWESNNETD